MRLLLVTQVIDRNDSVLGAYHRWTAELSKHFERVEAICLFEGEHSLPANVRVHTLGKEHVRPMPGFARRLLYSIRFISLTWKLRHEYDAVFVHMNQEYLLIAGPMWKLLGKRMYMWRNHLTGSWLTDIAAALCVKVFCTSRFSYTARYRKTILMPVGVDTERFHPDANIARIPGSILFLARMSPSKDPFLLVEALRELSERTIPFKALFVGSPTPEHEAYYRSLIERVEQYALSDRITFLPAVPNREAPDLYRAHDIFVNTTRSGAFDKTLFEAAACGCIVLAASEDLREAVGDEVSFTPDSGSLSERLETCLTQSEEARAILSGKLTKAASSNALSVLIESLQREITT